MFWFVENLGKIPENGAKRCLTSKNGAQCLQKNAWKPILEVTPVPSPRGGAMVGLALQI